MKRAFLFACLLSLISSAAFSFSEKDIISPISGTWCNQQALVLSSLNSSEVYYSLTGTDPFVSGFAYDGPILIEKKGEVCVRLGIVETDGSKKEFQIKYNVLPAELSNFENEQKKFIEKNLLKSPLITYKSGTDFLIPSFLKYSFDKNRSPYMKQKIKLQSTNELERFVTFFVSDGINNYHSVIRVLPLEKKVIEKTLDLPFIISNWENFIFNEKKFIYQIDDEMWNSDYSERIIDRSKEHIIRWQSVDFSKSNQVYDFVLPRIPNIEVKNYGEGVVAFILSGDDDFTFENGKKTFFAEAFYGEESEGVYESKIFYKGLFNGIINVPYKVDKLAPIEPEFIASENSKFSRNTIALKLNCPIDADVYYAVSSPIFYDVENELLVDNEIKIPQEFLKYIGDDIVLKSIDSTPCVYKVFAYSVDNAGNVSSTVEQKYIIDELNFYLSCKSKSNIADGSFMNPFTSLQQAINAINSSEGGMRLHLKDDIFVNEGELILKKDLVLHGNGSKIIFNENSSLSIENSKVVIDNCTLEKNDNKNSSILAKINKSNFSLYECEIVGFYKEDGKLFDIKHSDVSFKDCGITIQSNRVSLCAEIIGGTYNSTGCRFTVIGQASSALKIKNSICSFNDNLFTLIGGICKGIEIINGSISFAEDIFNAQSDGKYKSSCAVYRNGACNVIGFSSIKTNGF